MENKSYMEKIKSDYIFQNILSYIEDKNILPKLFLFSKALKKKYNIDLLKYHEEYFNKRIKWTDYLCFTQNTDKSEFKKNNDLKNKLDKILSDYNCSIEDNNIKSIINNYFSNNFKDDNFYHIDIYSPFFDFLSKSEVFDEMFIIEIPFDLISQCHLNKDYISKFSKLNFKYSSISFSIANLNQIKYINEFKIDFNSLKKLQIRQLTNYSENEKNNKDYNNKLSSNILPLINSANNLVYFSLSLNFSNINSKSFEFINNFNLLEYLELRDLIFDTRFYLDLPNLKRLELFFCRNINLSKEINTKLKYLILYDTSIHSYRQFNFPELEEISLESYIGREDVFQELKKLKKFKGNLNNFVTIESELLEEITIKINSFKDLEKMFEKINSFKLLKILTLTLENVKDEGITNIKFENTTVKKMHINYYPENNSCKFYNLPNKFTNLSDLFIYLHNKKDNYTLETPKYKFLENPNSKVKNIHLNIFKKINDFEINFQSYEKLETIDFYIFDNEMEIKNFFPLLCEKSDLIFKSLKSFSLQLFIFEFDFNILNNIYNNLDNMPNLIDFKLKVYLKECKDDIYKNFVAKVISMKYIKKIYIAISIKDNGFFSRKELKMLFPNININKFIQIDIQKPAVDKSKKKSKKSKKKCKIM